MELAPDLHHGFVFKSMNYENNRYHNDARRVINTWFCSGAFSAG